MGQMIDLQTDRLQAVITICNYNSYQTAVTTEGHQTGHRTGQTWAGHGPEDNKGKQLEQKKAPSAKNPLGWPLDSFERFYSGYPKKVDRNDAVRAFAKVQAQGAITFEALLAARDRYAEQVRQTERQFIKAPAVWLNKGSYMDEPAGRPAGDLVAIPLRDPKTFTRSEWGDRLQMVQDGTRWPAQWGPPPGEPGCLVPLDLLPEREAVAS